MSVMQAADQLATALKELDRLYSLLGQNAAERVRKHTGRALQRLPESSPLLPKLQEIDKEATAILDHIQTTRQRVSALQTTIDNWGGDE